MKYFVLLLLLTSSLSAQDDAGISFIERPFAELLDQAKAEDKLIFQFSMALFHPEILE